MAETKGGRLTSLDAFRGFIMLTLAASGFGLLSLAKGKLDANPESSFWQFIKFHADHPEWRSNFWVAGVSYWDLIQPAFMFMVGVAMPFSYTKRLNQGDSYGTMFGHAVARAVILILLGVFLSSAHGKQTDWTFVNVLTQIGLGYVFVFLLAGRPAILQMLAVAGILIGYWIWFVRFPTPGAETLSDHFAMNTNAAWKFDVRFLNLFPRPVPFEFNKGGYCTLNFIPSMATMLMGVMAGDLLMGQRRPWDKVLILLASGAACMVAGLALGYTVCPIVKRIWTPSWALFSGAYVLWMLAGFYALFDIAQVRWLAFPLVVLGTNSILLYVMGQLLRPWTAQQLLIHFGRLKFEFTLFGKQVAFDYAQAMTEKPWGAVWQSCSVMLVFWLICLWLHRQKLFVRI